MSNWKDILVQRNATLRAAVQCIDAGAMQIALIVDSDRRLLGTLTDGDVRRAILKGLSLDTPVHEAMNSSPTTASISEPSESVLALMRQKQLLQIPVLDDEGRVVGIEILGDLLQPPRRRNPVVIMAGGLGSRLGKLTQDRPKPMLPVGNKPILETILESFLAAGFTRFHFAVGYKADVIQAHFGDGSAWGASIGYLQEQQRLGTAGALSILPEKPDLPMIVMNGDILTKVNFQHLLDFHQEQKVLATICVREFESQIPYGVVAVENQRVIRLDEKPVIRHFVSAGIYVLDPAVLDRLPRNTQMDMPQLLGGLMAEGKAPAAFPLREYWLDIGRIDDYERAHGDYPGIFG